MSTIRSRFASLVLALLGCLFTTAALRAQECPTCGQMSISPVPTQFDTAGLGGGTYTAKFLVGNTHTYDVDVSLSCSASSGISCGTVTPSSLSMSASSVSDTVRVQYTVSATGAKTLTLTGYHDAESANPVWGQKDIQVTGAPTVTLQVPAGTTRAVVATRQPVIRAFFMPNGAAIDTTKTVLQWRGSTVTSLTRHNRGLLEWEVDSTRALGLTGDSALVSVTACTAANQCTVVTRWAVLPNDDTPVVGFTGMPVGTLGSGYGAPFGPGLSVHQAEVETGFGIPSYVSMGAPRSASLVYSTRQSYPRAVVLVDLEVRWPVGTPDQIKLLLKDGGVTLDSLQLASPTCATGGTRRCRASLQADYAGTTFATPTRKWLKVEARITSGVTTKSSVDSVEVVLVDRRATAYGSGWWPAGVSQLVRSGTDFLLVGPTGTATIYRGNLDSTLYLPPPGVFTGLTKIVTRWELRPRGSLAYVLFNSDGKVGAAVDANGNRDSVAYDGSGRVAKFRDPLAKEITFTYDGNGKLSLIEDAASRDNKVSVNPSTYELTYDSLSSPTSRPARTTLTYQGYGGATGTMVLTKRLGTILDTTIVTYDARRRPTQVDLPSVMNPGTGSLAKPVIGYGAYEQRGNGALVALDSTYVQMTDPRGFWTKALLTRWGQAARSWDELGLLGKSTYDPDGFLLWSEGKNGDSSRTYQVYDALKRAVKSYIVRASGDTLRGDSLIYAASHRVVQTVDNRGKSTYLTYDIKSNVIVVKTPNGDSTRTWYRSDGLVDSVRQPNATAAQRYVYEATWKNIERVMDPSGDTLGINYYDNLGRLDSTISKIKGDTLTGREWRKSKLYYNTSNQVDSTVTMRASVVGGGSPTWPSLTDTLNTNWVRSRFDAAGARFAPDQQPGQGHTLSLRSAGAVGEPAAVDGLKCGERLDGVRLGR